MVSDPGQVSGRWIVNYTCFEAILLSALDQWSMIQAKSLGRWIVNYTCLDAIFLYVLDREWSMIQARRLGDG